MLETASIAVVEYHGLAKAPREQTLKGEMREKRNKIEENHQEVKLGLDATLYSDMKRVLGRVHICGVFLPPESP